MDLNSTTPNAKFTCYLKEDYEKWVMSSNMAIAYMLVRMSDMLQTKMEGKETAMDILDALQAMFDMQNEQARVELIQWCTSTKTTLRTLVRDHVMKMTNYVAQGELYGFKDG